MPIINIYLDNETYIAFLQKSRTERERIRKEANKTIKEETNAKTKGV